MWDLTLPGYKYLGPGNKLNKGKPRNENDRAALSHDQWYEVYLDSGANPYTQYSTADDFVRRQFTTNDYGGALGKAFFTAKYGAYKAGLIKDVNENPSLRGTKRKWDQRDTIPNSLSNMQSAPQVESLSARADGQGSGKNPGLKETPVDNPYVVYRGPPDYTFASLPWIYEYNAIELDRHTTDWIFRMTSPYDCRVETSTTDLNAGAGTMNVRDENESAQNPARWFNYYAGMYNYYHVVSCHYKVTIQNLKTKPIFAFLMFYNDTQPPRGASNHDMQLWRDVRWKRLDALGHALLTTGNDEGANNIGDDEIDEAMANTAAVSNFESVMVDSKGTTLKSFEGEYRPGMFKREIHLDSEVENWTAVSTNPSLPEKLLIRIRPDNEGAGLNDANLYGDDMCYRIRVELSYLVEFKELAGGLRWPVQRQPVTVTIANDISSTS